MTITKPIIDSHLSIFFLLPYSFYPVDQKSEGSGIPRRKMTGTPMPAILPLMFLYFCGFPLIPLDFNCRKFTIPQPSVRLNFVSATFKVPIKYLAV